MESAIDQHLVCPRTLSRRVPEDYQPPFPMFVGRGDTSVAQVVMAYLGVQYAEEAQHDQALAALRQIVATFGLDSGPVSHDLTYHLDNRGHHNLMAVAYWSDVASYDAWRTAEKVAGWWDSEDRLTDGLGYFREVTAPRVEQLETLYAFQERLPGIGSVMSRISGEINEHGYWGSMRERMPLSQTDWMQQRGELTVLSGDPQAGGRVVISGHDNIALIRSGQDWIEAGPEERSLYLEEILPTLQAGMDFLRDNGQEVGCYSNRFVQSIDIDGNLLDESYNIGHWAALDKLERWAESHPTHLRIFTTFFKVATGLDKLRLYHEVSVSDGAAQHFEYVNCHSGTGMLRDARVASPVSPA